MKTILYMYMNYRVSKYPSNSTSQVVLRENVHKIFYLFVHIFVERIDIVYSEKLEWMLPTSAEFHKRRIQLICDVLSMKRSDYLYTNVHRSVGIQSTEYSSNLSIIFSQIYWTVHRNRRGKTLLIWADDSVSTQPTVITSKRWSLPHEPDLSRL